jgi:Putative restriction endonuclease
MAVMVETSWPALFKAWRGMDVPAGWRSEILGDRIVVSPPLSDQCLSVLSLVRRQLTRFVPDEFVVCQVRGVSVAALSLLLVPSLVVVPRGMVGAGPVAAGMAAVVVEVASAGDLETDRTTKRSGYAEGGVPFYLLIDRCDSCVVTLFSEPVDGGYRRFVRVPLGGKVVVPGPFGFELDCAEF